MPSDDRSSTRRGYLRVAGTAALAALAGCGAFGRDDETAPGETAGETTDTTTTGDGASGETTGTTTASESPETTTGPPTDGYETVVNVAKAGADTSGEEPVNPVLDEHLGDDTLLYFPPGRYRLTDWRVVDYRNLGIVGEDATLVPPPDERNYWLMCDELRDFRLEGFEFDCRAPDVAPITYLTVTGGSNVVRDIAIRGHRKRPQNGFEIAVANPKSDLLFDRVRLPDGSNRGVAIYTFPKSVGRLTFLNCHVEHWKEGLYASPHSGPLAVEGGYYANNGIDQIRVGGGPNGAVVRGATVRVDEPKRPKFKPNMRGIWQEEGAHLRVEGCVLSFTDLTGTYSSGAIVVGRQGGATDVRNTRIRTDVDTHAIHVRRPVTSAKGQVMPSMDRLPKSRKVTCENVEIVGDAAHGAAVRVDQRDDVDFRNVCVQQPEGERDGALVQHTDGVSIRDSTIAVAGKAIRTTDAKVSTKNLRTKGNCRL